MKEPFEMEKSNNCDEFVCSGSGLLSELSRKSFVYIQCVPAFQNCILINLEVKSLKLHHLWIGQDNLFYVLVQFARSIFRRKTAHKH